MQRVLFLYGDALTAALHDSIYDRTLRQITQLGNREYIEILLAAHERIVIQKGQFHQLMHQLGCIYTQFYGGFMQAMQVGNGVKQVNGDPVKGGYQTHHLFAVGLYRAANRLMLRSICSDGAFNEISSMETNSNEQHLRSIIEKYKTIRESWEVSSHEPSRVVALFQKSMRSYMRCKRAINAHDSWQLEIESCEIMSLWKTFGKNTYLKLQCDYMENFYDIERVPAIDRESMRANAFCVKPSGSSVAFDEEIEHYNYILKKTPCTPYLDVAVMRSRHVIAGNKAGVEMWGVPRERSKIHGTSLEDDVTELEQLMRSASVFVSHTATTMHRDYFWAFVKPKPGVGSPRDHCKTTVEYNEHEHELVRRVFAKDIQDDYAQNGEEHEDGEGLRDDISAVSNDESICANSISSKAVRGCTIATTMMTTMRCFYHRRKEIGDWRRQ